VLLWQIPLVPTDREDDGQVAVDVATMLERGYGVREADGTAYRNRGWWFPGALLVDWSNPEATDWWLAKRRYLLDDLGVDGFKTDGGEHAWGDELRYADGSRGDASNNLYPLRYAQAYRRLLTDCGVEGVTFSRAGFTGAGSAPCHWAGDEDSTWEAFRASIVAGLTAGISGVPFWGWDLGGFSGDVPPVELYVRAAAMAALCPIMQYHSEFNHHRQPSNDRTPWNIASRHGDDRAIAIYRRFANLRERLHPLLTDWAEATVVTGVPMMRPLWFDDPNDPTSWAAPFQYRFGPDLVVAPVCWPDRAELDVYLPAGEWIDVWTGERHAGGAWIRRATPWDIIPVYCRDASVDALRSVFETA
jgi:1,3-alpha-isomaltosidase